MRINVKRVVEGKLEKAMSPEDYEIWRHLQPHVRQLVLQIAMIERLDAVIERLGEGSK